MVIGKRHSGILVFLIFSMVCLPSLVSAAEEFEVKVYLNTTVPWYYLDEAAPQDIPDGSFLTQVYVYAACSKYDGNGDFWFDVLDESERVLVTERFRMSGDSHGDYNPAVYDFFYEPLRASAIAVNHEDDCNNYGYCERAYLELLQLNQTSYTLEINRSTVRSNLPSLQTLVPDIGAPGLKSYLGDEARIVSAETQEFVLGSSNPRVLVYPDASGSSELDDEGRPMTFTISPDQFALNAVRACSDYNMNGKCDFIEAQYCSGDWFVGACCNGARQPDTQLLEAGDMTLCRQHVDADNNGGTDIDCVGVSETLYTDFTGDITHRDTLSLRLSTTSDALKDPDNTCQLCAKYSNGDNTNVECQSLGDVVTIDFLNDVGYGHTLTVWLQCDVVADSNIEICARYADNNGRYDAEWMCGGLNEKDAVHIEFVGDVNENDDLDFELRYKKIDVNCGEVLTIDGHQIACGENQLGAYHFATDEDLNEAFDFTGPTCRDLSTGYGPGFVVPYEQDGEFFFETCGAGLVLQTAEPDVDTCGKELRNQQLCSYTDENSLPELFDPIPGSSRFVPCADSTFVFNNASAVNRWVQCGEQGDIWDGPLNVAGQDFVCNTNRSAIGQCCKETGCDNYDAEAIMVHDSFSDGTATYYCIETNGRQTVHFSEDLDDTADEYYESRSNCEQARLPDGTPANYAWTGSACCSEFDDTGREPIGEYYNDPHPTQATGGCWNGTLVQSDFFVSRFPTTSGHYATAAETDVVNVNGVFYGCSLIDGDTRLAQIDHLSSSVQPVLQRKDACSVLQSFAGSVYVCGVNRKWMRVSQSDQSHLLDGNQSVQSTIVPGFNLLINPGFEETK